MKLSVFLKSTKELLKNKGSAPVYNTGGNIVGTTAKGKSTWICECEDNYIRSKLEEKCIYCNASKK